MKLNKKYIKFHEIDNNAYYLLPFEDERYVATESLITLEKNILFLKFRKKFTQGLKLLQLTGPITLLFDELINTDIKEEDLDFPDMTTYQKIDNIELRKKIETIYNSNLDAEIRNATEEFEKWKDDLILNNEDLSEDELNKVIKANESRLQQNIQFIKATNILSSLSFKWKLGDSAVIKKLLDDGKLFLYSQKIGSSYKIYYLYDLDDFGTITIYKVHCVKEIVKTIETFIYNREIIQELIACMANNNL